LSIFNEVNSFWEKESFDGNYSHTKMFYGGSDTEENYELKGNRQYSKTNITYHLNENGYRIPGKHYTPNNSKSNIVCFGCSQTLGVGLPWNETWPFYLDEMFNYRFNIKNYGRGGASINQITRLVYNYTYSNTPKAILCLLPDIYRREYFQKTSPNSNKTLGLMQYCPIRDEKNIDIKRTEEVISGVKKEFEGLAVNALDWMAYKRLSGEDNSIYNLIKDIKFLELISKSKNIPLYIFSWEWNIISCFYNKRLVSSCICLPTSKEIKALSESREEMGRDNAHFGPRCNKIFASIFHRYLEPLL
jgi:hypothetical protein